MPVKRIAIFGHGRGKQRGAALMVMLVIMIVGVAAIFVSSLNSSSLHISRDKTTADALAQAKDALIGRAAADPESPGSLSCPDTGDDGSAEPTVGQPGGNCPSYIGRLPWRTLGLPDLRDGTGERLWYALSPNFRDYVALNPINSESQGMLNTSGINAASNVIAIVFAPGSALSGQSRSGSQTAACTTTVDTPKESLCATNYLEGSNASQNLPAAPNTNYQTAAASAAFNDQTLLITRDQLFPAVEMRIAREAKSCLDSYAQLSASKYPWAAPVSDTANYLGTYDTRFGRFPVQPSASTGTSSDPVLAALVDAITALQLALNNYAANINASTTTALSNAGSALINSSNTVQINQPTQPELPNSITNQTDQTGDHAIKLANNQGGLTIADVQSDISTANSNLSVAGVSSNSNDSSMSLGWPSGCSITASSYWAAWRNLIFYQVASGYQPGIGSPACGSTCLSINGSGTYRAAVLVASRAITIGTPPVLQNRTNPAANPPTPYLEGINPHSGVAPATTFETYNSSDPIHATINDLVLCLDGGISCK